MSADAVGRRRPVINHIARELKIMTQAKASSSEVRPNFLVGCTNSQMTNLSALIRVRVDESSI
ncbi:hypothetical protein Dvina_40795 [Dactylosporangium vinaceum]|uniref:Uncharacterized protein n=1 Tax=Dactylosporangium vinaceum TaxID=53362 RepID=A0ABV5M3N3_9ACTN|nr:hypothetical protein [Dactylosporangium vinaceum]UAB94426.1 hypothetical protein Dvina_40795 [Dactylosporangium vinaceum]